MYDIIYIGGGLNYAGAVIAAKKGLKVALIERSLDQLGGVCLHKGCIPSKMFLHYAQTVLQSRESIFKGEITLDMQTLFNKKTQLIDAATKAVARQCKDIELIEGEGHITAPHQVSVNGTLYEGRHIIIGTGSSAYIPEGINYDRKHILSSDDVLDLESLPKEIAIYGVGAIGLEMASFFVSAGVKTTLISRGEDLLREAHPRIQNAMEKQIEALGITYMKSSPISKAVATDQGVQITFDQGDSLYTEKMLVATGRSPNTAVVATDAISVNKSIRTDAHFETTAAGHYAIGDCNGKLQLAHAARAEALNVTMRILGKEPNALNLDHVVKFIHTLPMSYATVGQNKTMLDAAGIPFHESIVPLNHFTASAFHQANNGSMIVYADEEGFILGGEILAPDAEELIAPVAMALAGEMDATLAKKTIMAHPTFSEALERAYFRL
ncbi:NAD(P)/FAD-dependent oxidoreductase [Sulfurovum sp.]|uniref:dihydrolipoyl dehydrogenase family protein n=1 Tax=Sulfurovum sp. TaxID=1969726 RepID=UPI0025EFBE68|nr:NAD(P)/FAD-dependent oxidoreductase [Sulfurovum sp.]